MWPKAVLAKSKCPLTMFVCIYVHINTPHYIHTYAWSAINVKLLAHFSFSSTK